MKNTAFDTDVNVTKAGSALNGRQLSFAMATGPLFVEGAGQFGPTLSTKTTGTKVISMTIEEPWVLIEVKGEQGRTLSAAVPLTSFTHTVLK